MFYCKLLWSFMRFEHRITRMPLSDVQREITKRVLDRYLNLKQPTPRKELVIKFKDPQALEWLVSKCILSTDNNSSTYLPLPLAFHYSGSSETERRAKESLDIILQVLRHLFETEENRADFTIADISEVARKMYAADTEKINLGLYLVRDFNVLTGYPID